MRTIVLRKKRYHRSSYRSRFVLLVKQVPKLTLQTLGRKLLEKRGELGVREVSAKIGISPATLSRVERGYLPDLDTFGKVCRWLNIDPGEVLGIRTGVKRMPKVAVHFRKDRELAPKTAHALAQLILAAQRALLHSEGGKQ
jgi:transcriptional regulator with XRE-family HTH domain